MDDIAPSKNNLPADLNKIDLSQLQGFSFGTQWVQDKSAAADRGGRDLRDERPRRDDRGPGAPGAPIERRDRRAFRKPADGLGGESGPPAPAGTGPGVSPGAPERQNFLGDRAPRHDGAAEFRGGPRRDGQGAGRVDPRFGGRSEPIDRTPYDSPYYTATFYPEDTSFNTLVKTIRASCRTIELFEVARTVVGKADRFVVVLSRRLGGPDGAPPPSDRQPFYISLPDGLPFESEDSAVAHVLAKHLGNFFDTAEVEIDPPKGNFQVVNKCGVTGELLGPPNYHRYNQLVQQHYAAKVARMPFEAFKARIETVREPEAIQAWLDKMKKTTRYTWKTAAVPVAPVAEVPTAVAPEISPQTPSATESGTGGESPTPAATVETPAVASEVAREVIAFDSFEDARTYLLAQAKDKIVRGVENARMHGKNLEVLPPGEIFRTIEGALERQRRFPLDTANALRGRLRREHFTIFKKGSKGVSYVCAVKRKFRVPGQTFSTSIGALIAFLEEHPMVRASELAKKFLNIAPPAEAPVGVEHTLSIEQREKLARIQGDLVWLVREGYVTEFIDGALYATPPMVESRKREFEASEHDPENFPDARATAAPFTSAAPQPAPAPALAASPTADPERTATVDESSKTDAPPSLEPAKESEPLAANIPPAEMQKTALPPTTA